MVADQRFPRDGRFIERLGYYNPVSNLQGDQVVEINLERLDHWVSNGAQMTPRVVKIVKQQKKSPAKEKAQ